MEPNGDKLGLVLKPFGGGLAIHGGLKKSQESQGGSVSQLVRRKTCKCSVYMGFLDLVLEFVSGLAGINHEGLRFTERHKTCSRLQLEPMILDSTCGGDYSPVSC